MGTEIRNKFRFTDDKKRTLRTLLTGTLIAYAITCIAFILCAILLRYTSFSEGSVPLFVTITSVVAVIVSGFDTGKSAEKNGWLWGMIAGVVYAAILICIGVWISENFSFDTRTFTLVVLSIAGGGLGGMIGINFK